MKENRYIAFISYRHQSPDMEIAQKLHTAIETFQIPSAIQQKNGIRKTGRVFRDQEELPLSADLGKDIEDALDNSEWLICVCSPNYLESRWCMREVEYFAEKKGKDHILTILAAGEPEKSFPKILRFRENENGGSEPVEPLAADVRAETLSDSLRKLRSEKLRLLAPMLSVTYDDLKQREKQRKKKRIAAIAITAFVILGILTGILIRNEALKREAAEQQRIAEEERLNAVSDSIEKNLQTAEVLRVESDRQSAAGLLLETLELSEQNGDMHREEILSELRKTAYIEPFSIMSVLDSQNLRLTNAAISPDGTKAVCIANGNAATMISLSTGKIEYTIPTDEKDISFLTFSPDGSRFLGICDNSRCVRVWNTADGSEELTWTGSQDKEEMLANALFWQGPDTLLVQDYDRFCLVSVEDGTETLFYTMGDQQNGYDDRKNLYSMLLGTSARDTITLQSDVYLHSTLLTSQDGSRVVVSGRDGSTGTLVLDDQGQRVSLLDSLPGTLMETYDISPDGKYVSCQSYIGFMGVWEADTGRMKYLHSLDRDVTTNISAPVFSPDSTRVAYISGNTLVIEQLPGGTELVREELEETWFPPKLRWTQDGQFLCFFNPNLYIVDAESGGIIVFRNGEENAPYNNAEPAGERMVFVTQGGGDAVCYSLPGGSSIVFQDDLNEELTGYDPLPESAVSWSSPPAGEHEITETYQTLLGMENGPSATCYSMDGNYAALIYPDGIIEVFQKEDPDTVYLVNAQFTEEPTAYGIVGDILCAADAHGRIMFQNLTDSEITVLKTENGNYGTFVFDPAGELLMAAKDHSYLIDVYSVPEAQKLFTMSSSEPFQHMGFTTDGESAAALTADSCMVAELWKDEVKLLEWAKLLAGYPEQP